MNRAKRLSAAAMMVIALAGCIAAPYRPPAGETAPLAPVLLDREAVMADGARLPLARWHGAAEGTPEAVFLALHGFNDYRCAFAVPAPALAGERGLVVAYDQRGFGATRDAGRWPGNARLVRDAATMVHLVRGRYPKARVYLLGESMGAAVALQVAAMSGPGETIDGVVLAAPAVWGWSNLNPFYAVSLRLAAAVAPGWRPTGESLGRVPSDNIAVLRAMARDGNVIKKTRIASVKGLVDTMDAGLASADAVRPPWLAVYGDRDEIIPSDPVTALADRLPERGTLRRFAGSYHLILRDHGRAPVIRAIRRFAGLSSNPPARRAEVGGSGPKACQAYEPTPAGDVRSRG